MSRTIPLHESSEKEPAQRGFGLGRAHREAVANTVDVYQRMLGEDCGLGAEEIRAFGDRVGEALHEGGEAALAEEIEGIAAGAGQDPSSLLAVNARTELLVGRGTQECSLVGLLPGASAEGRCIVAQNWDWHPDFAASTLLWKVRTETGTFVTLTEAGILAKIGVNDRRLCCGLNFISSSSDRRAPTADPIHLILRRVLEWAGDLEGAVAIVAKASPAASASVVIASGEPGGEGIASLELTPRQLYRRNPNEDGAVTHTNHFLIALDGEVDRTAEGEDLRGSWTRLGRLDAAASERPSVGELQRLLASHEDDPYGLCAHRSGDEVPWVERYETLASVVVDVSNARMMVASGTACNGSYADLGSVMGSPEEQLS